MSIILNGSTGITTPADSITGNATVGGTLTVTGATTLAGTTLGATTATSLTIGGVAPVAVAPGAVGNVIFTTDGSTWSSTQKIVQGTAVVSTSGTSISFTSIPSWVKRITLMLQGVSTTGTSKVLVRIGTSGGIASTGYLGSNFGNGIANTETTGFAVAPEMTAAILFHGAMTIANFSGNTWVSSVAIGRSDGPNAYAGGGSLALASALTQLSITTVNGTDTFDAGSVNIFYE